MAERPVRIQRKRERGWRLSEGAVYVGRPSKWGNPFIVGKPCGVFDGKDGRCLGIRDEVEILIPTLTLSQSLEFYRNVLDGYLTPEMYPHGHLWAERLHKNFGSFSTKSVVRRHLRGKNLACFCPLDQPCHADILLEIANG